MSNWEETVKYAIKIFGKTINQPKFWYFIDGKIVAITNNSDLYFYGAKNPHNIDYDLNKFGFDIPLISDYVLLCDYTMYQKTVTKLENLYLQLVRKTLE